MQEYNFTLHHRPGKTMSKADALSRWAGHDQGKGDNEDVTVLKKEWFRAVSIDSDTAILDQIQKVHRNRDKSVIASLQQKTDEWTESDDGIVTWKDRIYVPVVEVHRLHLQIPVCWCDISP